ncbi:MAG TPA: HAD-IA family hydrolase [Stellaceae bacterium]|nr:HAD-IA family hydrolase [Stellaceae bacterium]
MATPPAFDALVFDVGGVIIPHDNEVLYRRLAARCAAADALAAICAAAREPPYELGERSIADLHARLQRELLYAGDWPVFLADWCSHLTVDPAMLAYVGDLARTHRVILFSNTNEEHWQHLLRLTDGALGRFEAYLSHELGLGKPDLAAFAAVAERARIAPPRSLFIDDKPANVAAARRAGFVAEVFTDQPTLERYLETTSR